MNEVEVGSSVKVLRGVVVGVRVAVEVGIACWVCVAAAPAVCWMYNWIAFGSEGGGGVGTAGTHARINTNAAKTMNNRFPGDNEVPCVRLIL